MGEKVALLFIRLVVFFLSFKLVWSLLDVLVSEFR